MASNFDSSIQKGSELCYDFRCVICNENDINMDAEIYCAQCSKFYCGKCAEHHSYLHKKHSILGKENITKWPVAKATEDVLTKWPVAKATEDVLEQCQVHKGDKVTAFCEDHEQLLCHVCHVRDHKNCSHVVLIADKIKAAHQEGDFKQLSAHVDILHGQLIRKKNDFEESMQYLEKSFKKILEEINASCKKINDYLDQLKRNTITELDSLLATLRTSMQADIENCNESIPKVKCIQKDWLKMKGKTETLHFIMYRKCLKQYIEIESILHGMTKNKDVTITFQPDTTIEQTLSTLSGLGKILSNVKQPPTVSSTKKDVITTEAKPKAQDPLSGLCKQPDHGNQTNVVNKPGLVSNPVSSLSTQPNPGNQTSDLKNSQSDRVSSPNQVIRVMSKREYSVKIMSDLDTCNVSGICETGAGELLILDSWNKKAKLLDKDYKVVAHCDLPDTPWSICSIHSNMVAVTAKGQQIHYIRMENGQLVHDRTQKLQHDCRGIAHNHGNLYITSGTALYKHTVDGRLVGKMYEDTSADTVTSCAVSLDGDRIYVANMASNKLVTLSRDGTVISTLGDPELMWHRRSLPGLQMTDSGQVLLCGGRSNIILQVDRDGRQRLAEVVTEKDNVTGPISVFYSKNTGTLTVGMLRTNNILMYMTQ